MGPGPEGSPALGMVEKVSNGVSGVDFPHGSLPMGRSACDTAAALKTSQLGGQGAQRTRFHLHGGTRYHPMRVKDFTAMKLL